MKCAPENPLLSSYKSFSCDYQGGDCLLNLWKWIIKAQCVVFKETYWIGTEWFLLDGSLEIKRCCFVFHWLIIRFYVYTKSRFTTSRTGSAHGFMTEKQLAVKTWDLVRRQTLFAIVFLTIKCCWITLVFQCYHLKIMSMRCDVHRHTVACSSAILICSSGVQHSSCGSWCDVMISTILWVTTLSRFWQHIHFFPFALFCFNYVGKFNCECISEKPKAASSRNSGEELSLQLWERAFRSGRLWADCLSK